MGNQYNQIISAINTFITSQKEENCNDNCKFTLIKFNDKHNIVVDDMPLQQVESFTTWHYYPSGMTALYDAMASVFEMYKDHKRLVMVVVTDGLDNASKIYSGDSGRAHISELVNKYKSAPYGWNIVYLCNDPVLVDQGKDLNIGRCGGDSTSSCSVDFRDLKVFTKRVLSRAVSQYRKGESRFVTMDQPTKLANLADITDTSRCATV
jgi:hypothetical protein